jgi:nitrogen regulatory protein PII
MDSAIRKLLTIITEAALETVLVKDLERLGVHGYTIADARGGGSRGARNAAWSENSNIRIEVVCDEDTAKALAAHLQTRYFEDYAMIMFMSDVAVLRPAKFLHQ